jgi:hypothetical protein
MTILFGFCFFARKILGRNNENFFKKTAKNHVLVEPLLAKAEMDFWPLCLGPTKNIFSNFLALSEKVRFQGKVLKASTKRTRGRPVFPSSGEISQMKFFC